MELLNTGTVPMTGKAFAIRAASNTRAIGTAYLEFKVYFFTPFWLTSPLADTPDETLKTTNQHASS